MRPGIDPKVDYAFKKVFGSESNRDVLVDLLNAVLQFDPGHEVVEVEILNPFNDKEFSDDKLSVVDIKAIDATGRVFAVEMQMLGRADHRQRLLYYATRLYSQQIVQGQDYRRLQPAYLISFVNSRVIPDSPAFHTRFVLRDTAHNLTFTDDFAVHMIELPKFLAAVGNSGGSLDNWCYFLLNANQLDADALPNPLASPAIRKAMETLRVISELERERELYESRRKRQLDDASLAAQYARQDAEFARIQAEYAQIQAEYAQVQAENAQVQAENARIRAEVRQKDEELRSQQLALVEHHRALANQLQALADRAETPEVKAEFRRQRDEQLGQVEALRNALRGAP